jgi:hypothetical protein
MTKPIITVVHGLPEDQDYFTETREMNDAEYAQYQADVETGAAHDAARAEAEAAAQAKKDAAAAVLAKLGITQDVLDLLTK